MPRTGSPLGVTALTPQRRQGTVTAVVSLAPPVATVQLGADTSTQQDMVCVASYSPTVGDVVWVLSCDGDHLIIGAQPVGNSPLIALPLGTNVTNYAGAYQTGQYAKTAGGLITVEGLLKTTAIRAAGSTWATLPVGCRPLATVTFLTWATGAATPTRIDVTYLGAIFTPTVGFAANDYISLGGISFIAEQ